MAGRPHTARLAGLQDNVATENHPVRRAHPGGRWHVHIRTTTPEFSCARLHRVAVVGGHPQPVEHGVHAGRFVGRVGRGARCRVRRRWRPAPTSVGRFASRASFCGVVGYKPPFGRVPAMAPFNLDQYCHDGPMARTVADAALLSNVISGRHPYDVVSLPDPPPLPLNADAVAGMEVALCVRLGDHPLAPEVQANTRRVAEVLRGIGVIVTEVDLPWSLERIHAAAWAHFGGIFGPEVARDVATHAELLTDYARAFVHVASSSVDFVEGLRLEGELYRPLGLLLAEHDALLCPTMGTTGFPVGQSYVDARCVVEERELPNYLMAALTPPFNIASRCPVLALPSGVADNGVPTGVQLVGRTYEDATVFRLAYAYEASLGGFGPGPDYPCRPSSRDPGGRSNMSFPRRQPCSSSGGSSPPTSPRRGPTPFSPTASGSPSSGRPTRPADWRRPTPRRSWPAASCCPASSTATPTS